MSNFEKLEKAGGSVEVEHIKGQDYAHAPQPALAPDALPIDVSRFAQPLPAPTREANRVAIILGYYEGQKYIAEQLHSIYNQTHKNLHVFVSDDQSSRPLDLDSLDLDEAQLDRLSVNVRAQNVGFSDNFLGALGHTDDDFEYYAFSDQDDVWHADKLEKALRALSSVSPEVPALYSARTEIVDVTCQQQRGLSPLFSLPPSFANALVQNIGGGNTMVMNKAARDLVNTTVRDNEVMSHDWWSYQIICGVGGYIVHDTEPCLKYRQHENNLIGANNDWQARWRRIKGLLQGEFREWNSINLKALSNHRHLLTHENQQILDAFSEARQSPLLKRIAMFKRAGIYRQTALGNLGLLLGIVINKV